MPACMQYNAMQYTIFLNTFHIKFSDKTLNTPQIATHSSTNTNTEKLSCFSPCLTDIFKHTHIYTHRLYPKLANI